MTVEVIILESKYQCLQFGDKCFTVAVGYFMSVVEYPIGKYCLRYADNNFTSRCWLFSTSGGYFYEKE